MASESLTEGSVEHSLARIAESLEELCEHAELIGAYLCQVQKAFKPTAGDPRTAFLEISGDVNTFPQG